MSYFCSLNFNKFTRVVYFLLEIDFGNSIKPVEPEDVVVFDISKLMNELASRYIDCIIAVLFYTTLCIFSLSSTFSIFVSVSLIWLSSQGL